MHTLHSVIPINFNESTIVVLYSEFRNFNSFLLPSFTSDILQFCNMSREIIVPKEKRLCQSCCSSVLLGICFGFVRKAGDVRPVGVTNFRPLYFSFVVFFPILWAILQNHNEISRHSTSYMELANGWPVNLADMSFLVNSRNCLHNCAFLLLNWIKKETQLVLLQHSVFEDLLIDKV